MGRVTRFAPGVILDALREAVTIVGPDEVLAVRVAPGTTDCEWAELRERAAGIREQHGVGVALIEGVEFARLKRAAQPDKAVGA